MDAELLRQKLEPHWSEAPVRRSADIGKGWMPLVSDLVDALVDTGKDFEIVQIKEKFGMLRFYANYKRIYDGRCQISNIVQAYENGSTFICENCGSYGRPRRKGWIKTLCHTCTKVVYG